MVCCALYRRHLSTASFVHFLKSLEAYIYIYIPREERNQIKAQLTKCLIRIPLTCPSIVRHYLLVSLVVRSKGAEYREYKVVSVVIHFCKKNHSFSQFFRLSVCPSVSLSVCINVRTVCISSVFPQNNCTAFTIYTYYSILTSTKSFNKKFLVIFKYCYS